MDYRDVIRKNNFRTKLVVCSYILIMLCIGLLADTATHSNPHLGLLENLLAFATFQQLPIGTFIVLGVAIIGILYIHFRGHKLMLAGMDVKEITAEDQEDDVEHQLYNILEELSLSAHLGYMPKLYILETEAPNAFAAGWSAKNGLVGVTRGLINQLNRQELQAVMAHEVGHIVHGDSKLTLYVGILANVILTVTNIFGFFLPRRGRNNDAAQKAQIILFALNFILPIVTQVLYLYLSRTREYMADAVVVDLTTDNQAMISALEKISGIHEENDYEKGDTGEHYRSAAYIFSKGDSIFSTHPSIENRIAALKGEVEIK